MTPRRIIALALPSLGLGLERLRLQGVNPGDPPDFPQTQGTVGMMSANCGYPSESLCKETHYKPSELESSFKANAVEWTSDKKELCHQLREGGAWDLLRDLKGDVPPDCKFSTMCVEGKPQQFIEPLAGILRDPRFLCESTHIFHKFSIEWLLLGDRTLQKEGGRNILFDAGGTRFRDAMHFFTRAYQKRGIVFDEIYVWEASKQREGLYWKDIPANVRQFWEPRLTYYNAVPVTADNVSMDNPVNRIFQTCKPDDYCVFKLDIDAPSVEMPIVHQLVDNPDTGKYLDEFFFEHHVTSKLSKQHLWGWSATEGTFADSYDIFTKLREKGVRAHSWI